jgi:hypothetical protein
VIVAMLVFFHAISMYAVYLRIKNRRLQKMQPAE